MMATTRTLPKPGCVLKVGDGRGFVIEYTVRIAPLAFPRKLRKRLRTFSELRTSGAAAYCQRTYKGLLGSIDGSKNDVWAECLFVDPVADIAILDCPDEQEMDEQADAYHALIDGAPVLRIGQVRPTCYPCVSGRTFLRPRLGAHLGWSLGVDDSVRVFGYVRYFAFDWSNQARHVGFTDLK